MDIAEGLQKIGEQVTDQAGGFPNTGTQGHGNASAERMSLTAELEIRTFKKIARRIEELCSQHQPDSWGFAAPSEINGAILDNLDHAWSDKLSINLKLDLTGVPSSEVAQRFHQTGQQRKP